MAGNGMDRLLLLFIALAVKGYSTGEAAGPSHYLPFAMPSAIGSIGGERKFAEWRRPEYRVRSRRLAHRAARPVGFPQAGEELDGFGVAFEGAPVQHLGFGLVERDQYRLAHRPSRRLSRARACQPSIHAPSAPP